MSDRIWRIAALLGLMAPGKDVSDEDHEIIQKMLDRTPGRPDWWYVDEFRTLMGWEPRP